LRACAANVRRKPGLQADFPKDTNGGAHPGHQDARQQRDRAHDCHGDLP
jgi:hypothetical protein